MDTETKKLLIEKKAMLKEIKSVGTILYIGGFIGTLLASGYNVLKGRPLFAEFGWDDYIGIAAVILGIIIETACQSEITEIEKKLIE